MTGIQEFQVSASGQMSLPTAVRRRWHLEVGGSVDVIDIGHAVMTVPKGQGSALLRDLLSAEDQADFIASLSDDPDLATT